MRPCPCRTPHPRSSCSFGRHRESPTGGPVAECSTVNYGPSGAGVAEVLDAGLYQGEDLGGGSFDGGGEYFGVELAVRQVSEFVAQCDGAAVCVTRP